jgi:hypothetical protein
MDNALMSFESIKFAYEILRVEMGTLPYLSEQICNVSHISIASKNYPLKSIYVYLS